MYHSAANCEHQKPTNRQLTSLKGHLHIGSVPQSVRMLTDERWATLQDTGSDEDQHGVCFFKGTNMSEILQDRPRDKRGLSAVETQESESSSSPWLKQPDALPMRTVYGAARALHFHWISLAPGTQHFSLSLIFAWFSENATPSISKSFSCKERLLS